MTRVLADTWYASRLECVTVEAAIRRAWSGPIGRRAAKIGPVRGLATFWISRGFDAIVTTPSARGALTLVWLEMLSRPRRRRIVMLELMWPASARSGGLRGALYPLYLRAAIAPPLRRVMARGQVLTSWEPAAYSELFGIPEGRLRHVPFPLSFSGSGFHLDHGRDRAATLTGQGSVVSSGRAACDWDTLFEAARGRGWPLTVICARHDLAHVWSLNRDGRARVLTEIAAEDHQRELEAAAVYALCLEERGMSSGHVRLGNAAQAGVAVVATRVRGLEGYVVDGETAILVEPGQPLAFREAIESLLADPDRRARISRQATEHAKQSDFEHYIAAIRALVEEAAEEGQQ